MRVVVVDPLAQMPAYDHTLCVALGARGHEVELATRFTHPRGPNPAGFRRSEPFGPLRAEWLTQHPGSPAGALLELTGLLGGYATLRRRVRREHWEIADWQSAPLPPFDIASLTAIRRHSGAVVFTTHDSLSTPKPWAVPFWGRLFRACDRVVVHSQHAKQKLLDQFGLMEEQVAVIPHALPPLTVRGPPVEPAVPVILFFGAIDADKGLDLLIEALPQVAAAVPAVELLVVGEPRIPLEPMLERAKVLRVSERIVWNSCVVSNEELPSMLARASVVAVPRQAIEGMLPLALAAGSRSLRRASAAFPI